MKINVWVSEVLVYNNAKMEFYEMPACSKATHLQVIRDRSLYQFGKRMRQMNFVETQYIASHIEYVLQTFFESV